MSFALFVSSILAFVLTTVLIIVLRPVARMFGLVDVPNARKVHEGEIPLIGGIAIFVAVVMSHAVSKWVFPDALGVGNYTSFYVAGGLLVLVGVLDDFRNLSPTIRLIAEAFAALIIIFGANVVVSSFGTLTSDGQSVMLGIAAVPFTVFAVVGLINAVNMSDGLDGLAGTLSLVPVLGFIFATTYLGDGKDLVILWSFAACIAGFLFFNVTVPGKRRALIFLGDSGSMFLGLMLAWLAIRLSQGEQAAITPAAALWFLTLPVFDAVCMTSRRIMRKRPMFSADKEHLHHVFLLAGFTVTETVLIMGGLAMVGVIVGLAGTYYEVPDIILAGAFVGLGLVYFWAILRAWTVMRFLRRSICRRRPFSDRRSGGERRRGRKGYGGHERRKAQRRQGERRVSASRNEELTEKMGTEDARRTRH